MNSAFVKTLETLKQVYGEKAFSAQALNKALALCHARERALVTKLVYGVLDEDIRLQYLISKYVKKRPKGDTQIILKMGVYCLDRLSMPVYAVVNDCAELAKTTGDVRQVGFVNATLKNISRSIADFDDYPQDAVQKMSVLYSYPEWALKKLIKDYGMTLAHAIVSYRHPPRTYVRICEQKHTFRDAQPTCFPDAISVSGRLPKLDESFTVQSLSSMAVARAAAAKKSDAFLDCCAAPGGKAVYFKQLQPNAHVVACDLHAHRVELIQSYARRLNVSIETHCMDMTQREKTWENKFDTVLCDVPCSGFGVVDSRPDVKLFRENKDISELMKTQYAILSNCSAYVKKGGRLIYSTCTLFKNENGQIVRKFLEAHPDFRWGQIQIEQLPQTKGKSEYQFLPCVDGMQAFYIAVLEREQ